VTLTWIPCRAKPQTARSLERGPQLAESQEALAHECGIGRTYLSSVERSERKVSIDNIARIAKGLKVGAWRLLRDD
jgi:transcriptional regulator with XRE-family HTH domain